MVSIWSIDEYTTLEGENPVKEFIDGLELKAQAKIYNTFELLKEFGIHLGAPHAKKLIGTELWELRIVGGDSLRVFYIAVKNRRFLLLHGFRKKTQKTPSKEVKIAKSRLREYRSRK